MMAGHVRWLQMRSRGLSLNRVALNGAMAACEAAGEWERALSLFDGEVLSQCRVTYSCTHNSEWAR